jgi:uncharacterized C2H2 Zn-finger protein
MAHTIEADNLVHSIARFIAGLSPKWGNQRYFERRRRSLVISKIIALKERAKGLQCPFCGRKFRRACSFVSHLVTVHYHDILEYVSREQND